MMAPIWIVAIATVRQRDFAQAWVLPNVRISERWWSFDRWWRNALVGAALLVPAVALATIAVVSPQPLELNCDERYAVEVVLHQGDRRPGDEPIRKSDHPHFALSSAVTMSRFWIVGYGPTELKPGQTAAYQLLPPVPTARRSLLGPHIELRALSDYPETLSSVPLPMLKAPGVPR